MASCALVDICASSREKCAAVVIAGAAPELIKVMATTKHLTVVENCIGCLFYITDDVKNRDPLLQQGVIPPLVKWAEHFLTSNRKKIPGRNKHTTTSNDKMAYQILRVFSNLCYYEAGETIDLSALLDFLPVLTRVLTDFQDDETIDEACSAIVHLTFDNKKSRLAVVKFRVCNPLAKLLIHPNQNVARNALIATANISAGGFTCKEEVLKCGVLPNLANLLNGSLDEDNLENIYLIIRNICVAAKPDYIQQIVDTQLIPGLVQIAKKGSEKVMLDAVVAITGILGNGSLQHVEYLLEQGISEALCYKLSRIKDEKIICLKLDLLVFLLNRVEYQLISCFSLKRLFDL